MEVPTVYIEREPLLNILMAAAEVYNRECLGYIFGRKPTKRQNRFVVTSAITCAAVVRRTNAHVRQSERAFRRMNELMQAEPASFPWLGDFHSHPSRPYRLACDLSAEDLNNMVTDDYRFGILVSISRRGKRPLEWRLKSRRTRLRGTLGKFDFHLVAHQLIRDAAGTAIRDEHGKPKARRLAIEVASQTLKSLNRSARLM